MGVLSEKCWLLFSFNVFLKQPRLDIFIISHHTESKEGRNRVLKSPVPDVSPVEGAFALQMGSSTDEPVCVSCSPQGVRAHGAEWNATGRVGSGVTSDAGSSGHTHTHTADKI